MDAVVSGRKLFLRAIEPRLVVGLAQDVELDRHIRMADPADVGALAVEHTFAVSFEPGLVEPSRDGVELYAEGRDRERMDDVLRDDIEFDHLADGNVSGVIDRQKGNVARLQVLILLDEGVKEKPPAILG